MQQLVNQINTTAMPNAPTNDRFSSVNKTTIVLGALLLVLAIIGTFLRSNE